MKIGLLSNSENGDTLLATGGEDSYIAIWRFKEFTSEVQSEEFEFQIQWFKNYKISFDSMIIGHDGWINSLHWGQDGKHVKNIRL